MTYGFGKSSDRIATSQITKMTGIDRRSVTRVLQDLEAAGMIWRSPLERGRSRRIGIVKDFERWVPDPTSGVVGDPGCSASTTGAGDPTSGVVDAPCGDRPTGSPARGVGSPETPLVGSSAPPTIEKERLTRESGAAAPARSHFSNSRKGNRKTACPEQLTRDEKAAVVGWADADHPDKFSRMELAAQWARFRRHCGKHQVRNADWVAAFENWLTHEYYRPLTDGRSAPAKDFVGSGPAPERTAEDQAQLEVDLEEVRKTLGAWRGKRKPLVVARSAARRDIAL